MKKWSSHRVDSPNEIVHTGSFEIGGDRTSHLFNSYVTQMECWDSQLAGIRANKATAKAKDTTTKTRAIFLLPSRKPPYAVYCNPFYNHAGYGNIFSTNSDGSLAKNIQDYEYCPKSAIHGMVFDPTETYLYSADMWANRIWCHKKIDDEGRLETVGYTEAEGEKDHPRWVECHPNGRYLYVLMEAGNRVCEYVVDPRTRLPVYTNRWFPLIPPGKSFLYLEMVGKGRALILTAGIPNPHMYRSDVVFLTQSSNYLFATSRANSFDLTGYIAAFKIAENGSIGRQICLNPTPTSGGHSNAVSPCPWSDEWLVLTDDEKGGVEIYRWHKEFLARVARLEIGEKGFGMNAIWYD